MINLQGHPVFFGFPQNRTLTRGFHYLRSKLRKHQQGSGNRSKKGRQLIKGTLARQVTTGYPGLVPGRNSTYALESLHLRGMRAGNPISCQFWVEGHSRGVYIGVSILLHFQSASQAGRWVLGFREYP